MSKHIKDITGNKYGNLLVLEFAGTNKYRSSLWKCLCDCGNTKIISGSCLKNGDTKSCGCLKFFDLTGKKFGKLTVIRSLGRKDRQIVWECLCECGNKTEVISASIRDGSTKSCGCLRRKLFAGTRVNRLVLIKELEEKDGSGYHKWECLCDCGNTKIVSGKRLIGGFITSCGCMGWIDLTGQKFGKLMVIKPSKRGPRSTTRWLCKCDCGKDHVVDGTALRSGHIRSCGCLLRDEQYETIKRIAYSSHLFHAKERGYVSELVFEQYCGIASHPCVYCNAFSIRKNPKTKAEMNFNSVDRKDNEPYYTLENSQSVCFNCQEMKMDRTHKEFLDHIQAIHKKYEQIDIIRFRLWARPYTT
jgi:hypothetical protein